MKALFYGRRYRRYMKRIGSGDQRRVRWRLKRHMAGVVLHFKIILRGGENS